MSTESESLTAARAAVNDMLHFTHDEIESGEALEFGRRLDAYESLARAEEREACIPLVCTMCRDGIKRTGPNAEGRCHHHVKVPGITVLVTQDCRASGIHVRARSPSSGTEAPR